jgi:hypothetical protein
MFSPNTRSKVDACHNALYEVLMPHRLKHWAYPIIATGVDTFAKFVDHYGLTNSENRYPAAASHAASDELYRVDVQRGGDEGRQLPNNQDAFNREWILVESLLVNGYHHELERLDMASRPGGARVYSDMVREKEKAKQRKRRERE